MVLCTFNFILQSILKSITTPHSITQQRLNKEYFNSCQHQTKLNLELAILYLIVMKSRNEQLNQLHHGHDPRQSLYKEIQTYRSKLTEYQQLQKQLNQIHLRMNASELSSSDADRLSRIKGSFDKTKQQVNKRNSHKKIKIYELQKKLQKVSRENQQKQNTLENNTEYHSKILWAIQDLSSKIEKEKKVSEQLKQLAEQIQSQLQINSVKIEEEVSHLEESAKNKQQCTFQRKKLRDDLKRIQLTIYNLSNNVNQDLEFSNSEEDEYVIKSEGTVERDCEQAEQSNRMYSDLDYWLAKENGKIEKLINKHDLSQEKNQDYLQHFYSLKKEMISNQILLKHHKVTINLQSSKIRNYHNTIQAYKHNIIKRGQTINELTTKINKVEGERGYLRGRIGVRIQQQRLVKSLNTLLEQDLDKVRDKLLYLKFIKGLLQIKQI